MSEAPQCLGCCCRSGCKRRVGRENFAEFDKPVDSDVIRGEIQMREGSAGREPDQELRCAILTKVAR